MERRGLDADRPRGVGGHPWQMCGASLSRLPAAARPLDLRPVDHLCVRLGEGGSRANAQVRADAQGAGEQQERIVLLLHRVVRQAIDLLEDARQCQLDRAEREGEVVPGDLDIRPCRIVADALRDAQAGVLLVLRAAREEDGEAVEERDRQRARLLDAWQQFAADAGRPRSAHHRGVLPVRTRIGRSVSRPRGPSACGSASRLRKLSTVGALEGVAELVRRLIFEMMRLVHDQMLVGRQDTAVRRHIGEQERVVDDHDVRVLRRPPRPLHEALPALLEDARRRAAIRPRIDAVPCLQRRPAAAPRL